MQSSITSYFENRTELQNKRKYFDITHTKDVTYSKIPSCSLLNDIIEFLKPVHTILKSQFFSSEKNGKFTNTYKHKTRIK